MTIETTFFSLKGTDITLDFIHEYFCIGSDGSRKVDPNFKLVLDEKKLREYDSEILKFKDIATLFGKETTVGRIILNLSLYTLKDTKYKSEAMQSDPYEVDVRELFTYKNFTMTANAIDALYKELSDKLVNAVVSSLVVEQFINNLNWISFTFVPYLNPSMDIKTINASKEVRKIKEDTLREHNDIIVNNDVKAFGNIIETKVLKAAAAHLDAQGSTGKIIYDSGVNGSFNNNYKLTALFRGVVPKSDDPTQYKIGLSSLTDGVRKDEISLAGDIAVQGSIGRAISTRTGGYLVKQFNSAFQSLVLDNPGTDCKTPRTLKMTLSEKDFATYEYRYIVEKGQLGQLTRENKDKYINKLIELRTPFYCQNIRICNKCAGDMLYKLGIKNIGLITANIGSALMNASLKAFHSLAVKTASYNIEDFIKEV